MSRILWKRWVRHCLGGAAVLTLAGLVQAQGTLPAIPDPVIIPTQAPAQAAPSLGLPVGPATPATPPAANVDALKAQLEQQQKQIQELMTRLNAMQNTGVPTSAPNTSSNTAAVQGGGLTTKDVQSIINGYFAEKEAQKAAEVQAAKADGYKVGSDMSMSASWNGGVYFQTKNKDFWFHVGGEMQFDNIFWGQNTPIMDPKGAAAKPAKGYQTGLSKGGIGELVDSDDFRRLRLWAEGGF